MPISKNQGALVGGGSLLPQDRTKLDNIVVPAKTNTNATRPPAKTDDVDQGWTPGSTWVHSGTIYTNVSNTKENAEWQSATDIFFFDTWEAAKAEITNSSNGTKYQNKLLSISNANGGVKSGTWTNPATISDPVADGEEAVYKCTTAAGSTASVTLLSRPTPPFRVTKIINDPTEAVPTADGHYIFNVTLNTGHPTGVAVGDIATKEGTIWTVRNKFGSSPEAVYVGDSTTTARIAVKVRGIWEAQWENVVVADNISTGAALATAINNYASGSVVRLRANRNVTITFSADATFNRAIIVENAERFTFSASGGTRTVTLSQQVQMGAATFNTLNVVVSATKSRFEGTRFNAGRVTTTGAETNFLRCSWYPGAGYTATSCLLVDSTSIVVENCRFDVEGNSLATLNFISKGTTTDGTFLRVSGCEFWSNSSGKVKSCIFEDTGSTKDWNYAVIVDNYTQCAMEEGFISVYAAGSNKYFWTVQGNRSEYIDRTNNSGANFSWFWGYKVHGLRIVGNSSANTPMSAVTVNNTQDALISANHFGNMGIKGTVDRWAVLATNTSGNTIVTGNNFQIANAALKRIVWISNTNATSVTSNIIRYTANPTTMEVVYGGSDSNHVVCVGNIVRPSGSATVTYINAAIGGQKAEANNTNTG